jgi:hypothetical protein
MASERSDIVGVVGPHGELITIFNLPPADTRRWVIRRKAEVVAAVRGGLLTPDEACQRYGLTLEEYEAWRDAFDRDGLAGLRTTLRGVRSSRRVA